MKKIKLKVYLGAVVFVAGSISAYVIAQPAEKLIKITARAFEYSPKEITLKKGEPVTLELNSIDLFHGFNMPDLGVRADLPPGKTVRVKVVPQKTGSFVFLCDNFCGAGHEEMNGKVTVVD